MLTLRCWKLGTPAGLSLKGLFSCVFRRTHRWKADHSFLTSVSVQQVAIPSQVKSESNFYHLIGILMETNWRGSLQVGKEVQEYISYWLSGTEDDPVHDEFSRNFVTKIYPKRWLIQQLMY